MWVDKMAVHGFSDACVFDGRLWQKQAVLQRQEQHMMSDITWMCLGSLTLNLETVSSCVAIDEPTE